MRLKIKIINNSNNPEPKYQKEGDSGFDFMANLLEDEEIIIEPLKRAVVPTGLHFQIPIGFELQVRPRSGLALKNGITVLNTPGTVDCFSEDMKISTIGGEKTFNDIDINDVVYSYNEVTEEIEKDVVIEKFDKGILPVFIIETDNGVIEITANTPVYTKRGWVLGSELNINDEILCLD
jgi:deoxyuridine 5'-triphosphate nucleotidohydrolase